MSVFRRFAFSSAAGTLALTLLGALLPSVGRAADDRVPHVDLGRIETSEGAMVAPLADGRKAELTLDPKLQHAAKRLLAAAHPMQGAVTLVQARTGRLLVFAESGSEGVLTRSHSPAASVLKLVTTAALLERGKVTTGDEVCTDGGTHRIERRHLEAPRHGRSVCAPFRLALGHSRNAAYAQLVTRHLSRDELIETASRFGFNKMLPFDVPVMLGTFEAPYGDLAFARAAAGFQGSTLSPLGAAELAYIVAAGGRQIRLRVVARAGDFVAPSEREMVGRATDEWTAKRLMRMMEVTTREGTSAEVFTDETGRPHLPGIVVAGKTGTLSPGPGEPTSSWFTGFAPSRKPEVIVSVLLVNGKVWRRKANEVARDMLRAYFHGRGRSNVSDPFEHPIASARSTKEDGEAGR
jgi:cell division protein FtsI/penicillin-binding protein 2